MKYIPLVWIALKRKPAEFCLTVGALTAAFTLFGVMVALNAAHKHAIDVTRLDRIYVTSRFNAVLGLPLRLRYQLEKIDGVVGVGAFRVLSGYFENPDRYISVYTVDDGMRRGWSEFPLSDAQWDKLLNTPDGAYLSYKSAADYGVKTGDSFSLIAPAGSRSDGGTSWSFTVLGIVGEEPEFHNGHIIGNFTYYDEARSYANRGRVHGFRVAIDAPERASEISRKIDEVFANSGTPTWSIPSKTNTESLDNSVVSTEWITQFVAGGSLFVVLFLVSCGLLQSVTERAHDFAVLKSLGYPNRVIAALVSAEAALPCVMGALAGTLLASVAGDLLPFVVPDDSFLVVVRPPIMSFGVFALALGVGLSVAVVSSFFPIRMLMRLDATRALTEQGR